MNKLIVHQDKSNKQFIAEVNGKISNLDYEMVDDNTIDFKSTFVPEDLRSKGFASKLAEQGIKYAQKEGFDIKASCPFVGEYIEKNPEYKEMLVEE